MVARERVPHKIVPWLLCCCSESCHDLAALEVPGRSEVEYASHPNDGSRRLRWCGETEDAGALAQREGGREEGQGVDGAQTGQSLP